MNKIARNIDWTPISETKKPKPEPSLAILLGVNSRAQEILITSILRHTSHRVHLIESGQMALESLQQHHFDLCILSYDMSVLNGPDTCKSIRSTDKMWHNVPIIGLLEHQSNLMMAECLSAGMNTFLCPPMSAQKILSIIAYYQHTAL